MSSVNSSVSSSSSSSNSKKLTGKRKINGVVTAMDECARNTCIANEDAVVKEVESYLTVPTLPTQNTDGEYNNPLKWWKNNEQSYPRVAKVARQYLSIPATSVPCESLFSAAGNIISPKRTLLCDRNLESMLVIQRNWKRCPRLCNLVAAKFDVASDESSSDEDDVVSAEKILPVINTSYIIKEKYIDYFSLLTF